MSDATYLQVEARAWVEVDLQLTACSWLVLDRSEMNSKTGQGIAIREDAFADPTAYRHYRVIEQHGRRCRSVTTKTCPLHMA